jgi:hypothetical protein
MCIVFITNIISLSSTTMFSIAELLQQLQRWPVLLTALSLHHLVQFVNLCCQLQPHLKLESTLPSAFSPSKLSDSVSPFLAQCLSACGSKVDNIVIKLTWQALDALICLSDQLPWRSCCYLSNMGCHIIINNA